MDISEESVDSDVDKAAATGQWQSRYILSNCRSSPRGKLAKVACLLCRDSRKFGDYGIFSHLFLYGLDKFEQYQG